MLTDKEERWLEQRGPIWLGKSLQLGSTTLSDSVRLGITIELSDLIELIGRKLEQLRSIDDVYSGTEVVNLIASRFRDHEERELYFAAINKNFVGD